MHYCGKLYLHTYKAKMFHFGCNIIIFGIIIYVDGARILGVFPSPMMSHQLVFRSLTKALADRGHEVVLVTTDPLYPNGGGPNNFQEIDIHNTSYPIWSEHLRKVGKGKAKDLLSQVLPGTQLFNHMYEIQMKSSQVQNMINTSKKFDLVIAEAFLKLISGFSFKFECPVILISSFGASYGQYQQFGAPNHPILYPNILRQILNNLTTIDILNELYIDFMLESNVIENEPIIEKINKKIFPESPSLKELDEKYTNMLFLNAHPLWERVRPVPINVIHVSGLKQTKVEQLSEEIKYLLDSSKNGVIYMSFGTSVNTGHIPSSIVQIFLNVFSQMKYDIILKWDNDTLPGKPDNVFISKWWPQPAILRHPNVKLFISQSGLSSCTESIAAGVPIVGIPMIFDQWFNIENIIYYKIGIKLDFNEINEQLLNYTINTVINDKSYKDNVIKLRNNMNDKPNTALERAVLWTEYLLRHGTSKHLQAPAATMSWIQYYELELITICFIFIIAVFLSLFSFLKIAMSICRTIILKKQFVNQNYA